MEVCIVYSENQPWNEHHIQIPVLILSFSFPFYLEINKNMELRVICEGYMEKDPALFLTYSRHSRNYISSPSLPPLTPYPHSFLALNLDEVFDHETVSICCGAQNGGGRDKTGIALRIWDTVGNEETGPCLCLTE